MGYLSNFKYDVFFSYAHKDNLTTHNLEQGWITQFYKDFKFQLDRYIDTKDIPEIWCDLELRKNMVFDDSIKKIINNSAIFLAFTSNSFYRSEYCCTKELTLFHNISLNSPLGISVEENNRIIQIQLLKKDNSQWLDEFKGVGCHEMFKPLNENSLNTLTDPGITLDAIRDADKYQTVLLKIVQDVCKTLETIKAKELIISSSIKNELKDTKETNTDVFIGKVSDKLSSLKNQVIKELEANKISVCKSEFPPPYPKLEHEKLVKEKITQAKLVVNLFDDITGLMISEDYPFSFLQEQALLAKNLKKEQFIFIPQELKFEELTDENHKNFLTNLLKNKTTDDNYNLIRELSVPTIIEHIKLKLSNLSFPDTSPSGILLDYNEVDIKYAVEYYNSRNVGDGKIYLANPGTGPFDSISKFEKALKEVNTVIIICVTAVQSWLQERIREIIRAINTERSSIVKLYVYRDSKLIDLNLSTLREIF